MIAHLHNLFQISGKTILLGSLLLSCSKQVEPTASTKFTKNSLNWKTATEDQVFGYFVYRSESEDGPFQLLNPTPLPGGGSTDEAREYEFVDNKAVPGQKYFYYLETLLYTNRKKRFSPTFPYQTPKS